LRTERQSSSPAGLQGNAAEAKDGAFASFTAPRSRYGFPKRVNNLINNRLERFARASGCVLRFLERGELAFHQFFLGKNGRAMFKAVTDCFRIDIKVHKCQGRYMIS
jgi:hypothetical protein